MSAAAFDPLLSVFSCATDSRPVADQPLSEIIDRMRGPELAKTTERICSIFAAAGGGAAGKRVAAADKKRLPGVTLAGAFDRRANAAWRDPSGLVQIDLDNLVPAKLAEARALLCAIPWVACLWASPSGAGLKGAVRVPGLMMPDPSRYTEAWRAVSRWLASVGLVTDPAAKDCARLAFLAHDPEAMHNPEAVAFPLDDWADAKPVQTPPPRSEPARAVPDAETERRALAYVQRMPPSVQGDNGSAALVAVVRSMRDGFDLTDAAMWRCLDAWNAERAHPPWSRAELEHALASVEREPAKRGRGWLLNAERPAESTRAEVCAEPEPWPMPTPIRYAEPPPFDLLTMLPSNLPELAEAVDAWTEAVQVPKELIAGAAVGLVSLACSRAVEVQCAPDWREPAPLWVLPLLRPGERKSAALGMLCRPFHDWTAGERKRMAEPLARFIERRRCMEAELCALRSKAAKGTGEAAARAKAEALDLAAELDAMPARLSAPDLLAQSYTPEGLRDLLESNGERVGIVSAEADAAELLGARYSDAGPSIDLLLCAHAGDPITTRRAGGRSVPLDRPAVGMVLTVQPEAVRAVLGDRAAKGRGLIDRMLLILPPSRMGSRLLDPAPVPAAVSEWWADAIGRLLALPWPGRCIVGYDGEPRRSTSQPRILTIDPEARRILWELRGMLESRLAEGCDLAPMSGFASKLPGACARLALAFAMLRDPGTEAVDGEAMRAACAWAPFLLAHHRAVLGEAAEPAEAHHGRRLWRAIQRRGRATMTARELFDLVRDSAVPTMTSFRPVLDLLAEHGAIRTVPGPAGHRGRPAELWQINPSLFPRDMRDHPEAREGAA